MKKYELMNIQGKDIVLDISHLLDQEVVYVNVTKLGKKFGKRIDNYMRLDETQEYMNILNASHVSDLELVKSVRGKYGGTYFHSDMLIHFLRWLSAEFSVKCDLYIRKKIQQAHDEKVKVNASIKANRDNKEWIEARDQGKSTRITLQDKVKEFCVYAQEQRGSPYRRCPFYKHITDGIYEYLGIEAPAGGKTPRDIYSGAVVEAIERAELKIVILLDEIMVNNGTREAIKKQIQNRLSRSELGIGV